MVLKTRAPQLELSRDLDVPADRLAAIIGGWREPALLESGGTFAQGGGWGILAAEPRLVFEAMGQSWQVTATDSGVIETGKGDPLAAFSRLLRKYSLAEPEEGEDGSAPFATSPAFQGGMIGYLGYDLAPLLERLPRRHARESRMPDIRMALFDTAVLLDQETGATRLAAWDLLGEGSAAVERRCKQWRKRIDSGLLAHHGRAEKPHPGTRLTAAFTRDEYQSAVRRVLEYIAAGDVFQVNLSQRFWVDTDANPLATYLRLKRESPAPFSAFLRWDDMAVVSASPEWFYQTNGERIVTRPIKGTRPRGSVASEDQRLAAELLASTKDRAELTMIVDLERNDLGRVCRYGTVAVRNAFRVESFAQVHHLVATVEGQLRSGLGPVDLIAAMFPGGSITGAPKIRAMEIIDELERNRRGLYTGAIGYLSRGGGSAFNIAIRTILFEGGRASFQVGGGIVADSDPEAEFEETLVKGRGMRAVLEGLEGRS
jgi:para-aminobenzoate synthetase component I